MKLQLQLPLKNPTITQGFGLANTIPSMLPVYQKLGLLGHNGIDFGAQDGTPVYASHDGTVTFADFDSSGGLGIVLRTNEAFEYGDSTAYFKTIYWHLKKGSIVVTVGEQVKAGQLIALADNTGLSTGSHLHFGLKPTAQNETDSTWFNTEQTNGYLGAVDSSPYFVTQPSGLKAFYDTMSFGQRSDDVIKLQTFLKKLGFFNVEPTGYYGSITRQAVLAFQVAYVNLSWYERYIMRGITVGEKTLAKLNELY